MQLNTNSRFWKKKINNMAKKKLTVTNRELKEINDRMEEVRFAINLAIDYFSNHPAKQALFEPILKEANKVSDHIYKSTCNTKHEIEVDGEE